MRLTYRTARVLDVLAAAPDSNRVVGERSGFRDQGRFALARALERLGLTTNTGRGVPGARPTPGRSHLWAGSRTASALMPRAPDRTEQRVRRLAVPLHGFSRSSTRCACAALGAGTLDS